MYRAFLAHAGDNKMCFFFSFLYLERAYDLIIVNSVICVAGAGRGPLVARCLKALDRANREATVLVVEKNPSAFVTYIHHL